MLEHFFGQFCFRESGGGLGRDPSVPQLGGNTGIFGVYDTPVYNDREYYGGTEGWGGNADPYA